MAEATTDERQKLVRQAYSKATTRLRETHRDEFDQLVSQEAEQLGINYKPKPSPEEKARQQMRELAEQYPHLAQEFVQQGGDPVDDDEQHDYDDERDNSAQSI